MNSDAATPNNCSKFFCEKCDFKCSKNSDWQRHIITKRHKKEIMESEMEIKTNAEFKCEVCLKIYKTNSGLWKHNKHCKEQIEITVEEPELKKELNKEDILLTIKEELATIVNNQIVSTNESNKHNEEFQKQTLELHKDMVTQIIEMLKTSLTTNNINNGQITNNNNYNQFNLQVYLNENCKNAMTINQFLDYLEPTVEELEATAHLGYVEGISRIIMRGFKNLEEYELPFHCSDLKREHIYLKNPDNQWVEEKDEKPLLLRFIKEVARKSFKNLSAWQKQNPNWANYHSKQNDIFNKIVGNSMSGATEEEQQANYEKIMKNIMKNTVIDRSKKNAFK